MGHLDRFVDASKDVWRNPSVLGVIIAQAILVMLAFFLCALIDFGIIGALNADALQFASEQATLEAFIAAVWNTHTVVIVGIVALIQIVLLLLLTSWFTAGVYGMIRNLLLDGSTTIREFAPMAKRFTMQIFRFGLLRFAIILVPLALFMFSLVTLAGTTQGFATPQQLTLFLVAAGIFALFGLALSFLLLYGEPAIVFEDLGAIQAAKRAMRLVREHLGTSFVAFLLAIGVVILANILFDLLAMPLRDSTAASASMAIAQNLILIALGAIVTIFIFRTYRHVTGGVIRTTPYRMRKAKKKR